MKKETIVDIKNLTLNYKTHNRITKVFDNFNLQIEESEKVTLLGRSGSGKSTLGKFLCGILPNTAHIENGEFTISDKKVFENREFISMNSIRGSKIAFIFQDAALSLNPVKTIEEQFTELLLFHKICKKSEVFDMAKKKLQSLRIDEYERILKSYPHQLSGGLAQRVCISMCLCLEPVLLIADEPTSALDVISAERVLENIRNLKDIAVLFITHDISVARKVSDRIIVINKGIICEEGTPEEIIENPKDPYTKNLVGAYKNIPKLKPEKVEKEKKILEIRNLSKFYGEKEVLKDINLSIYSQEIFGIIGESGCGKSTLSRCILGLENHIDGKIIFKEDIELQKLTRKERRKFSPKIQMIFQNSRSVLNPGKNCRTLVMEALDYNKLYDKEKRLEIAENLLEKVEIPKDHWFARPPELSTGQCQRIGIARALAINPELLVADEAVSSLDVENQYQILSLLQKLKKEFNLTIIMISHDIRILKNYCNRLGIMRNGKFVEIIESENVDNSKDDYTQYLLKFANKLPV